MSNDCLAITGNSPLLFIVAGFLVVVTGLYFVKASRVLTAAVVLTAAFALFTGFDATTSPASALCSPEPSSLLQGQFRVVGGTVQIGELPVVTASNGATTITAVWGTPHLSSTDTVAAFAFPGLTAGDWTLEVSEGNSTAFEFLNSDLSFVVNSSRMLTGGPFNATTVAPVSVSVSGLTFELAVTRG